MGITKAISDYISENKLSVGQISGDTGVDAKKIMPDTSEVLSAEELLTLCSYLNIRPEEMVTHIIK